MASGFGHFAWAGLLFSLSVASSAGEFPEGFLWGAATSAHQVEGGNLQNDWAAWEELGKVPPAGRASGHYRRYPEDFRLARQMHLGAYRMSIEWSRVEPEEDAYSAGEIDHYRRVLKLARQMGLKTFVTLHHFTNPQWVSRIGSWENDEVPAKFARYTRAMVEALGDLVDFWVTVNEPTVTALTSYGVGVTPPFVKDFSKAYSVLKNLLRGHGLAYDEIHKRIPGAKVGFAHHMRAFSPANPWSPLDQGAVLAADRIWNQEPLDAVKGKLDYVGVNYYSRDFLAFDVSAPEKFRIVPNPDPGARFTDMGWEIYPDGFRQVLVKAARLGLPIYVTENGIADRKDTQRGTFVCEHLRALLKARAEGADVRGYLYWALLDNYEWIYGFGPRFGLIEVDYGNLSRRIRTSGELFGRIAEENSLASCQ